MSYEGVSVWIKKSIAAHLVFWRVKRVPYHIEKIFIQYIYKSKKWKGYRNDYGLDGMKAVGKWFDCVNNSQILSLIPGKIGFHRSDFLLTMIYVKK